MSTVDQIRSADAKYKPIAPFSDWSSCSIVPHELTSYSERLKSASNPELLKKARRIASRAAAVETGAIENLYEADRGFTFTVATETAEWELALQSKDEKTRNLIETQLAAYEFVLDLATKQTPVTEAWIRQLHTELCKSQQTYLAYTEVGMQELELPLGSYKALSNHVRKQNGEIHSYCPVDLVPQEMHRLVEEVLSNEFQKANPIIQAAYVHHCLTVIHPFADGNGRVARALASVFTYRAYSVPALIFAENRRAYFNALESADTGKYQPFCDFMFSRVLEAMECVSQSLAAAAVPTVDELVTDLEKLLATKNLYTQQQLQAGKTRFLKAFAESLEQRLNATGLRQMKFEVKRKAKPPTRPLPTSKSKVVPPLVGDEPILLSFTTVKPLPSALTLEYAAHVKEDPSADDLVTLESTTAAVGRLGLRVSDVIPVLKSSAQLRVSMFADEMISRALSLLKVQLETQKKKKEKGQGSH